MTTYATLTTLILAAAFGTATLCLDCGPDAVASDDHKPVVLTTATDTMSVRLHISGMTCGSCPLTARLALKKVVGVYSAQVTLDDSLGVVLYDPELVAPTKISSELTRLTGYGVKVIDPSGEPRGN